jgi:hypothetical protein
MEVFEVVMDFDPKTRTKMAKALYEGFKMLFDFNHEYFSVKEDGVLIVKQTEDMNEDSMAGTRNPVSRNNGDDDTPSTYVGLKSNCEIVTPESSPNKKGKKSGKSFMSNLREVTTTGKMKFERNYSTQKKYEFHYYFTEPIRQENGGQKVCLMMSGYVDKVKDNDMFIFKPHMVKKTFELISALGGLEVDFKYSKDI